MKTLKDIQKISWEQREELYGQLIAIVKENDLKKLKDFLKEYPVQDSFYNPMFADPKGKSVDQRSPKTGEWETVYTGEPCEKEPLFDPFWIIYEAAIVCGDNNLDFSILDYLFDKYGLSFKNPLNNFEYARHKEIKEISDDKIITEGAWPLVDSYIYHAEEPSEKIVKYLIDKGARVDVYKDDTGWSFLHFVAHDNRKEWLKMMEAAVKGGYDINVQILPHKDRWDTYQVGGETPLIESIQCDVPPRFKMTELLLELKADVNVFTNRIRLPISYLNNSKKEKELIKTFEKAGALYRDEFFEKHNIPDFDLWHKEIGKMEYLTIAQMIRDLLKKEKELKRVLTQKEVIESFPEVFKMIEEKTGETFEPKK